MDCEDAYDILKMWSREYDSLQEHIKNHPELKPKEIDRMSRDLSERVSRIMAWVVLGSEEQQRIVKKIIGDAEYE